MVTKVKQTGIGLLPEDWDSVCICDPSLCVIVNGLTYKPDNVKSYGTLVLRSSNIQNGRVSLKDNTYVDCFIPNHLFIKENDVLICVRNGSRALIGKAALIEKSFPATFGAFMVVLRGKFGKFLYYLFCSDIIQNQIRKQCGATINQITNKDFCSFYVPIPQNVEEQKAITAALSDIDHLISLTEKKIAKKELVKQGIIQELLSGKKRINSKRTNMKKSEMGIIPEEWEVLRIKDIFRLLPNNTFPRNVMNSECGTLQNIHYGDVLTIYGDIIDCDKDHIPYFNPDVFIRDDLKLRSGDVIIADTAEDNTVGKTTEVINVGTRKIFAGLHTILLRPKNDRFVHGFLGLFFNTDLFRAQLLPFVTGTKVSSVSKESIKNLLVLCPPKNEQKEIVRIVRDSDKEISEQKKYLGKLQGIKAGMMTDLLTGKIRLQKDLSHDEQIDDAVMISAIVNAFYTEKYPLGRKKVQKLLYLARRHQNTTPTGFLKKAAGPYKPSARYSGGEKIAAKNGYITIAESSQGARFSVGSKIAKAIDYAEQWGCLPVINWLVENFKYTKVDELEVLATVDMAICDLKSSGQNCSVSEIKALINQNSEWKEKLQKPYFSDRNIDMAIKKSLILFDNNACDNQSRSQ